MDDHSEKQLYACLARLNRDADFNKFKDLYLDGVLFAEYSQACIDEEHPALAQGAAQLLQRILREIEGAEETFYKLTNQGEIPLPPSRNQ